MTHSEHDTFSKSSYHECITQILIKLSNSNTKIRCLNVFTGKNALQML